MHVFINNDEHTRTQISHAHTIIIMWGLGEARHRRIELAASKITHGYVAPFDRDISKYIYIYIRVCVRMCVGVCLNAYMHC